MKKLLITISPLCVMLFILMWISGGLKGVLIFFGVILFLIAFAALFVKWIKFVDEHIKD